MSSHDLTFHFAVRFLFVQCIVTSSLRLRAATPCAFPTIVGEDTSPQDRFGYAIDASGHRAIFGAPEDDGPSNSGAAYVFVYEGGQWTQEEKLKASDATGGAEFGTSVAIDGIYAAVGAPYDEDGAVYMFRRTSFGWLEESKLVRPPGESWRFGYAVALDDDALVVGTLSGSEVYFYRRLDGVWTTDGEVTGSDTQPGDHFGQAVGMASGTAVVGAPDNNGAGSRAGAAYAFDRSEQGWVETARLVAADTATDHYFGESVAILGDTIVVGAPNADGEIPRSGAAYRFHRDGDQWNESATLVAPVAEVYGDFGQAVSVQTTAVLVGSARRASYLYGCDRDNCEFVAQFPSGTTDPNSMYATSAALAEDFALVGDHNRNEAGGDSGAVLPYGVSLGEDCNANNINDDCEPELDCNMNGIQDICDVAGGEEDCNGNEIPDECEAEEDCNANGVRDICDIADGTSADCDADGVPDECQIAVDPQRDCDGDGAIDACDETDVVVWDNGSPPGICSAIRPTAGWSEFGILDDFTLHIPSAFDFVRVQMLDGTTPFGEMSTIENGRVRIFDITGRTMADLEFGVDVPIFDQAYSVVEGTMIRSLGGQFLFSRDLMYFDFQSACTPLDAGHYALMLNYPDVGPADSFWSFATPPIGGGDELVRVFGPNVNEPNATACPAVAFRFERFEPDCDLNGVDDRCDLQEGSLTDDNRNGIPDSCEPDCNGNGIPDICEIEGGDADGDGVLDTCDNCPALANPDQTDCDADGIGDACATGDGFVHDCNANLIPDVCELPFNASSPILTPFRRNFEQVYIVPGAQPTANDVALTVTARSGNLDEELGFATIELNELFIATIFHGLQPDCGEATESVHIPADIYNDAVASGEVRINMIPSVFLHECTGSDTYIQVDVHHGIAGDCNRNLVPDSCDIASGDSPDENGDGVPDECALGDADGDGDVDTSDFATYLDCVTGPGGNASISCRVFDFDFDSDVDRHDFAIFQRLVTSPPPLAPSRGN